MTHPIPGADSERFEAFWADQIKNNGGVEIGADYRHWALLGYRAAAKVCANVESIDTPEFRKLCDAYHCASQDQIESTYQAIYEFVDADRAAGAPADEGTDYQKLYNELRKVIDGASESMTHEDAVLEVKSITAAPSTPTPAETPKPVHQVELDPKFGTWMDIKEADVAVWNRKHFNVRTVYAAPAPIAGDVEKDAARYRWLVEKFGQTQLPCFLEDKLSHGYIADGKTSIDTAIDAAAMLANSSSGEAG